ncbi:MAG: hypothetical protein AAGA75_07585 [Cyanobacteria bacterium P01_E01_bin.6]
MSWNSLGSVGITDYDWKTFGTPDLGARIFRLTQSYTDGKHPYGKLTLSSVFSNSARSVYRRVYPQNERPTVLEMPIPDEFVQINQLVRFIQVKPTLRTRWQADSNWTAQLDYWEPSDSGLSRDGKLNELISDLERIEAKIDALT